MVASHTREQPLTVAEAKLALRSKVQAKAHKAKLLELSQHHPTGFPIATFTLGLILGSKHGRRFIARRLNRMLGLDIFALFTRHRRSDDKPSNS